MRRLLLILFLSCGIQHMSLAQAQEQTFSKSPYACEWAGIYERYRYDAKGNFGNFQTKCILKITHTGSGIIIRGKDLEPTGEFITYWDPIIVTAHTDSTINFYVKNEYQFTFIFKYNGNGYAELVLQRLLRFENSSSYWFYPQYSIDLFPNDNW